LHPKRVTGVRPKISEPTGTAMMFDTALLIASALSLALMVVFSELA
jgi:hypothetical protein